MYTRNIKNPPEKIVYSGKPQFGDFNAAPVDFDIRKLKQPFSLMPLPRFITDLRIRTNVSLSFVTDEYTGTIDILDANWFGFAEVNIWEKESAKKISFRSFIIFRKRLVPFKIKSGICKSLRKKRIFIIRWNYETGKFSAIFRLKGDKLRSDISFEFSGSLNDPVCGVHTSVIPAPLMRRCSAVHHSTPLVCGKMAGHFFTKNNAASVSVLNIPVFFTLRRSYYKLRTHCYSVTVLGKTETNVLRFNLYTSSQDPVDADLYNENILFIDGESSPLPPVTLTHPYGLAEKWVIQDTENMVDILFTPLSDVIRRQSILILRTEYHTIYGTCEGSVRNKNGKIFVLKNFPAIVKKQYLRL